MERDKKHGWDHEAGTKDGKDVSYAIFDKPAKNKKQIYVKLPDGSFRFSPREDVNPAARRRRGRTTLPHSMLGKGRKVIGAGECETNQDGKIIRADNFSGHYQPNEENLQETKDNMEKQGLANENAKFEVFDKSGKVIKKL
jgi:hypothetical protein